MNVRACYLSGAIIATMSAWAAVSPRPNVLFLAVDDLNTCPEICRGETAIRTPNLERLARQGVLYLNAHCAAPAYNPSRTSAMTGIAPATSGVYMNSQDWRANRFLKDRVSLPGHFQTHGYETLGGGKLYHASSLSRKAYTGYLDPRPWDAYFPSKEQMTQPGAQNRDASQTTTGRDPIMKQLKGKRRTPPTQRANRARSERLCPQ